MSGRSMTVLGYVGVTRGHRRDPHRARPSRRGARRSPSRHHDGGAAVGGGADLEQVQRVGHHRAGQHVLDGDRLLVAGVGVGQAVDVAFLTLTLAKSVARGAVEVHAAAGGQGEVRGVGGADEAEAQPVRVGRAVAGVGGEEPLRGGVGADHEGDVAQAGQDPGAGGLDGGDARRAGGVATTPPGPRSSPGPGRRWRRRRSRGSRCAWCRRRTRTARRTRRCRRRAARRGRRPRRTPRSCGPTCPRGACRRRARRRRCGHQLLSSVPGPASAGAGPGLPLPDQVVGVVVAEQHVDHQLHLLAHVEVVDATPATTWPMTTRPSVARCTAAMANGTCSAVGTT
jgi:hypothetical protein